ncbi:DUF6113 family protein [Streptomyces roseicoloratus]|uniref:DUF6113 family protein n=1 Tax=Streptomyces roseicoloratus TaxID=2508722 RepID=A0ABY9RTD4_9ACTN|nr:DUF6113 family protein [Streptomyces roseicoloratus]WMX45215.1 DUF6113 family protein [Streptomyces roseicoloratus]
MTGPRSRASASGGTPAPTPRRAPGADHGHAAALAPAARYVWYAVLLVLGFLVGTAGSLVQAAWFPAGLLLALLGSGALFYGARRATGNQVGVAAAGSGWLVSVVLLSFGRPEGDGLFGGGLGKCSSCSRAWRSL